jgi:hypothetical protein
MVVHGEGRPITVVGDFRMESNVQNVDFSERADLGGQSIQQARQAPLTATFGIG